MTLAAKPFVAAVNHLLARESWARERLAPYAGKTARLSSPPLVLTLLVQPDGYLGTVGETDAQQFDVTLSVPADAFPAFVQGGQAAVMKHVKIEGDAEFATVIAKLAEHLRWEPEEDLAKLIGDGPAWRIASFVRTLGEQVQRTGRNLLDTASEYLLDENPQLVRRATLADFNAELAQARDTLARVEKRLQRLEQKVEARGAIAPGGAATSRGTR
ncbi:sterol-binding protein [bacterium M00.F.Ca.ET.228.01.1.1]|uniref:ubiquinone biosynthesis accessory factor UbiJ n=1 Tax=Paraburkholderia phenoliruptrix TaxID=252970 RepID=UPI001092D11E|nr:SCP2 sterol-binding domain-containing protein [Paraburkholderia phenoliruptrix]TGP41909.1 sterol-binding protein [bacterium M00.F.Ca.ET.228.01.1.1]TGR99341.1 sterol-binding protein [bacterium M00.F.Ca.ET.191.01.1.1]TGU03707.1 sterol-binding protein [bacterium M00.F.Ca.ET.155.01.1.1]MBW0449204.1 SCP2 sterol-binding domain-containing protein [Paraburkholderia phenoliruptrix]MBW9099757.1 SCP2 sterol-binding domain-containing protein [Paraburkholderia phenoliruptrix]